MVGVLLGHVGGLLSREVLDALVRLEVVLYVEGLSGLVDPFIGVGAVAVHESVAFGSSSVGEEDHELVERLRVVLQEIELHVGVNQVGLGVPLLRVDEVGELDWVVDEKDRSVVSNEIIVALLSVELNCESPWVSRSVRGPFLTSNSREPCENGGLPPNFTQEMSLRVLAHILSDDKLTVCPRSLGVNHPLGDPLPIKASKLVNESEVLEQDGSPRPSRH
mmetsp:Transcript_10017/g.16832  ORF Transcript_10017/g.16832 Transcript_10017/m.16832 type:complete len:220 (-) Transcript_10017:161-820(-)